MSDEKQAFSFRGFSFLRHIDGVMDYAKPIGAVAGFLAFPGDEAGSAAFATAIVSALSVLHYWVKRKSAS